MKKRGAALLMAAVLGVSALSGCGAREETVGKETAGKEMVGKETTSEVSGKETSGETVAESAEEAVEVTGDLYAYDKVSENTNVPLYTNDYWKQFAGTTITAAFFKRELDESKNFEDKFIIQDIEAVTGIDLQWIPMDSNSSKEKIGTMLADSANMPDIFWGGLDTATISANRELFADLNAPGMLDTYGTHILKKYEEGGQGLVQLLTHADGSIRSLATNQGGDYGSNFGSFGWINHTWCEAVGKEVPTTMEELVEVLRLFKTEDPNGNGVADEIPLSFNESNSVGLQNLANSFGIGGEGNNDYRYWYNAEDGVVKTVCDTPEWREFLEFCHELSKEGLIDKEGFSDTYEQYTSKLAMDRVGFFYGWSPSNLQVPNEEDWTAIDPFTIRDDVTYKKSSFLNKCYANLPGFAIAASSENKEAALLVFDLLHSSVEWGIAARSARYYWNPDGNFGAGDDGGGWPTEEFIAKWGDLDGNIVTYSYGIGENAGYLLPSEAGGFRDTTLKRGEKYLTGVNEGKEVFTYDRAYVYDQYFEYTREGEGKEVAGTRFLQPEDAAESANIEVDLFPYIRNFYADAVINGLDDAKWDAFVDGLEDYGYYRWIDWYQRYYNYEI